MAQLRVALAQLNPVVGDIDGNRELVLTWTARAAAAGAHVVAFPESMLTGYPVEDLALRPSFQAASRTAVDTLAASLADAGFADLLVVVGYIDSMPDDAPRLGRPAGAAQNAAALIHNGRVVARYAKHHLPNYGVFDEHRYFVPGNSLAIVRLHGVDIAVVICEDLWQEGGPVAVTREAGAGLLLVINASPYERAKDDARLHLATLRSAQAGCPLAYVNCVGGQDELVFDGDSVVVATDGSVLARAPQFEEALLVCDLVLAPASTRMHDEASDLMAPDRTPVRIERTLLSDEPLHFEPMSPAPLSPRLGDEAEVYAALVTGLRDYVQKNAFRSVVLGLSGGIDSALCAAVAVDAIGATQVHGVSLPSVYSSEHSVDDAVDLARRTGLHYSVVEIAPMVEAFLSSMTLTGLAEENLQARVRGTTLMALSNAHGHLVLTTGNKSELSVGYSTLYGDSAGGFAPIKDVPKTMVWALSRWRNADAVARGETPPIPESSITKEPSAELRPDQRDTDSLPPYDVLDALLESYVELDHGTDELIGLGFDPALVERVVRMVDAAEYKRRQSAPGTKISRRGFGRDRRLPITNRWRDTAGADGSVPTAPALVSPPGEGSAP